MSSGGRLDSLARLAVALARHTVRQPFRRGHGFEDRRVLETYREDGFTALTPVERSLLPAMSRCISCGICALVAGRFDGRYVPDLPATYLRPLHLLPAVSADVEPAPAKSEGRDASPGTADVDLIAAAAACPVGVPLPAVALMVRRLAGRLAGAEGQREAGRL